MKKVMKYKDHTIIYFDFFFFFFFKKIFYSRIKKQYLYAYIFILYHYLNYYLINPNNNY